MCFLSLAFLCLFSTKEDMMESPPVQAPSPSGMSDLPQVGRHREPTPSSAADSSNLIRARGRSPFLVLGLINRRAWSGHKQHHSHLPLCLCRLLIFRSVVAMTFREWQRQTMHFQDGVMETQRGVSFREERYVSHETGEWL